uniref:Uncharacterized protein n=1 Tax=Zea mays TaxID=4577 RepID=A0A804PCM2_MAIZE
MKEYHCDVRHVLHLHCHRPWQKKNPNIIRQTTDLWSEVNDDEGIDRRARTQVASRSLIQPPLSPEPAFSGHAPALREPLGVGAVVVDHELPLHPAHAAVAGVAELLVPPAAASSRLLHGADGALRPAAGPDAGVGAEPAERGDERRPRPVRLDAAALRGPVVGVPEAGVHPHGLRPRERHPAGLAVGEVPHRRAVHREDDVPRVPHHGVGVEVGGGVEPEAELLLPLPPPAREHVRVQRVGLARHVAQELQVDLVVRVALRRQVQGRHGARRVARHQLHLHLDLAEQVLVLGLEPGPGGPVQAQVQPAPAVHHLAAPLPPGHLRVLVEVAAMRDARYARRHRHEADQRGRPHLLLLLLLLLPCSSSSSSCL